MRIPATLVRKPVIKKSWYAKDDPQAPRVYRLEREFIGWAVLTQHSLAFLASVSRHACRSWEVAEAPIKVSSKPNDGTYGRCCGTHIWLNSARERPGNNLSTLIHELAHWITDRTYGDDLHNHSKEFVYVYGKLLDQYKLFPFDCFRRLCRKHRVAIGRA